MFSILPAGFRLLILSLLYDHPNFDGLAPSPPVLSFELRQEHATANGSRTIFRDLDRSLTLTEETTFDVRTRSMMRSATLDDPGEVLGPDVGRRETLRSLAIMANNAYVEHGDKDWYNLPSGWNQVCGCFMQSG